MLRLDVIADRVFSAPIDADQEMVSNEIGNPFRAEVLPRNFVWLETRIRGYCLDDLFNPRTG